MDSQKVDLFIMTNAEYFEAHQLAEIKERLLNCSLDNPITALFFATSCMAKSVLPSCALAKKTKTIRCNNSRILFINSLLMIN